MFPICWPEPFGLVMIEAMACGTPVMAYPLGSVPEVIGDGVSGYIVPDLDSAVQAVKKSMTSTEKRFENTLSGISQPIGWLRNMLPFTNG